MIANYYNNKASVTYTGISVCTSDFNFNVKGKGI